MTKLVNLKNDCNFLVKDARDKYLSKGLNYGWKANNLLKEDQGHWNQMILKNSHFFPYDQMRNPSIIYHPEIKQLFNVIKDIIGDRALLRTYINGYTFGTDGYAHQDDIWIPKTYGASALSETVIVYLNSEWDKNWGGETVIFNDEDEIEIAVLPKFARMLIFDSNKWHAARPLSRICKELRSVLVFKTIDRKIESKEMLYLLEKTKNKKHSGKFFIEHLFNTALLLEKKKYSKEVCSAALFHSIYDTEFYKLDDNSITRSDVTTLIGEYAESLVYEFCITKNRYKTFLDNTKNYNDNFLHDIISIEIANLADQNLDGRFNIKILTLQEKIKQPNRGKNES